MAKIKSPKSKVNITPCSNCFKSNHIVFSFAYITFMDNLGEKEKQALVDRMFEVSKVNYLELMRWDKYKGFEEERLQINKEIPIGFDNDIKKFDGKYTIMRLYKNNNPTPRKNHWENNKQSVLHILY